MISCLNIEVYTLFIRIYMRFSTVSGSPPFGEPASSFLPLDFRAQARATPSLPDALVTEMVSGFARLITICPK